MDEPLKPRHDHQEGTTASWYEGREITEEKREFFRQRSRRSHQAKLAAVARVAQATQEPNTPRLDPASLMPQAPQHHLPSLSLFSGGGGLDLGFERAGFAHVAGYDTLEAAGRTLEQNRPAWRVHSGTGGNVTEVDWRTHRGDLAVIHGGPPCQPFSVAGRQRGHADERNMLPEFVRAVKEAQPLAFAAENVTALAGPKFARTWTVTSSGLSRRTTT